MLKTAHMSSDPLTYPHLVIGLVQGVYGDHGNLELVVPNRDRGFRVSWCNGDAVEAAGVPPRGWSRGLDVDTGGRVEGVRIAQVPHGPWYLEASLLQAGEALRWTWRPDLGFVPGGAIGPSTCAPSAIVAQDDLLHVLTANGDRVVHRVASTDAYPATTWSERTVLAAEGPVTAVDLVPRLGRLLALVVAGGHARVHDLGGATTEPARLAGTWRTAVLVGSPPSPVGLGADGALRGAAVPAAGAFDAATAASSTLDGGVLEVVALRGDQVLHARAGRSGFVPIGVIGSLGA